MLAEGSQTAPIAAEAYTVCLRTGKTLPNRRGERRWRGSSDNLTGLRQRRTNRSNSDLVSFGVRETKRSLSERQALVPGLCCYLGCLDQAGQCTMSGFPCWHPSIQLQ